MDFTAIDFETANYQRHSACQLAAVKVRDGQIVDQQCWWIRPRPFYFSPMNIRVHGIEPERVADEPEFGQCWSMIHRYLRDECLIAHNAPFDIGVLIACLQFHGLPVPELDFSCTRLVARSAWAGRPGYGLKPLADWLGITFRHHDALEDSTACAKVLLAAADTVGASAMEELEEKLLLRRGAAGQWGVRAASRIRRRTRKAAAEQPARPSLEFF
jgi:DNA polymerase III subunit epsilon